MNSKLLDFEYDQNGMAFFKTKNNDTKNIEVFKGEQSDSEKNSPLIKRKNTEMRVINDEYFTAQNPQL